MKGKQYVADFETTVYYGQKYTEVWAAALVEVGCDNVSVVNSLDSFMEICFKLKGTNYVYFHNLKFDGSFILNWLKSREDFKPALVTDSKTGDVHFIPDKFLTSGQYSYFISDMGQWYNITVVKGRTKIIFRDSLKLLPFSVDTIAKSFGTRVGKLKIEYKGMRRGGGVITQAEEEYIKHDVLVMSEALAFMFGQGNTKATIGANCLSEYKMLTTREKFKALFPDLSKIKLEEEIFGQGDVDKFIRKAYRGGWCYADERFTGRVIKEGCTADVNSLYPSVMSSESGCTYPYGRPKVWAGNYIPADAIGKFRFYYLRVSFSFKLKDGYLPCIQIKGDYNYAGNEWQKSSSIKDKKTGDELMSWDMAIVTMNLSQIDWEMIKEHYHLCNVKIHAGVYFAACSGLFDDYIDKYRQLKINAPTKAHRTLAKLFLNNLYGKFATSPIDSFKYITGENDAGGIKFGIQHSEEANVVFIAVGAAVTAYARRFTITAAQANYEHFCYADTDSIHCCTSKERLKGVTLHPRNFCCFNVESEWSEAIFARQKTYIERNIKEEGIELEKSALNVKCAGMPQASKNILIGVIERSMTKDLYRANRHSVKDYLIGVKSIEDFKSGLTVGGKLMPHQIKGGVVLMECLFTMK